MGTCQIFDDFPCDDETCYGRNKGGTSRNVPALCAFVLCTWRADAVGSAADGHIFYGPGGQFFGVYHFQFLHAPLL